MISRMFSFMHVIFGVLQNSTKIKCFACNNRRDYIKFRACTYLWND